MRVRRIGYVSKRTEDVEAMTSFFRDVIGLESPSEGETIPFQRLPTHRPGSLEVYAREHRDARLIPDDADLVIAFVVDDIQEAMVEVQAAGVELVGEPSRRRRRSATPHSASSGGSLFARAGRAGRTTRRHAHLAVHLVTA